MTPSLASMTVGEVKRWRWRWRWRWPWGWHLADVLVTLPFVVIGQLDVWHPFGDNGPTPDLAGPRLAEAAVMLTFTGVVLWRRRFPLAVLTMMFAVNLVQVL